MSLRVNLDLDWNLIGNHSQMMIRQVQPFYFSISYTTYNKKHIYPSADITVTCWALI